MKSSAGMPKKRLVFFLIGPIFTIGAAMTLLFLFSSPMTGKGNAQSEREDEVGHQADSWRTYRDETFGFHIAYPENLRAIPLDATENANQPDGLSPDGGVSFATPTVIAKGGPGTMGVKVYADVPFESTEAWLDRWNANRQTLRKERTIEIGGEEALVVFSVSVGPDFEETFPKEKRAVFLKNGDLYQIWTRFYEHPAACEMVWKGFGFDPPSE